MLSTNHCMILLITHSNLKMIKLKIKNLLLVIVFLATSHAFSQQVLKPQEAFPIEVFIQNDVIQVNHRIENGYYLYKDKINYASVSYTHLRAHETGRKSRMPSSA